MYKKYVRKYFTKIKLSYYLNFQKIGYLYIINNIYNYIYIYNNIYISYILLLLLL